MDAEHKAAGLSVLAREAHERLAALDRALDGLSHERKAAALASIAAESPALARLINPYYGRFGTP